jgi:hypothetical protein
VTGVVVQERTFTVLAWLADRRIVLHVPEIEASTVVTAMDDADAAARELICDLTGIDAAAVRCTISVGRPGRI